MYRITVNNGLTAQGDGLMVIDPVLEEPVGCAGCLTYSIPYNDPLYDTYKERLTDVQVTAEDNSLPMWRGVLLKTTMDFWGNKKMVFEGEMAFLNDVIFPPFVHQGDIPELMEKVLTHYNSRCAAGREIHLGTVTVEDPNHYIYRSSEGFNTCWKVLTEKLSESLGGYFRLRYGIDGKRYLDYLLDPGTANRQKIEFGKNLLNIEKYIDTTELATVMIPLGAEIEGEEGKRVDITTAAENTSGSMYIETPLVAEYGRIECVVIWDDVTVPDNLWRKAQAEAAQMIARSMQITADIVDLHLTDAEQESLNVGDIISCVSPPHGIEIDMMLTRRTRHLNDPSKDKISLGTERKIYTESMSDGFREVKDEREEQRRYNADLSHRIETAKGMYRTVIQQEDGSEVIYMHDKPQLGDSQLIMNFSSEGFHASGDYGATWYGQDFDGEFLARLLEAYRIKADHIYGGTLASIATDENGMPITYINMDSGEVAKFGNIAWIKRTSGNESLKWMGDVATNGN